MQNHKNAQGKKDMASSYVTTVAHNDCGLKPNDLLDQHFLACDQAVRLEVSALLEGWPAGGTGKGDLRVAELGAGIGSVAQALPHTVRATLVELDPKLCVALRELANQRPNLQVACCDAIGWLKSNHAGAVLSNLPSFLTHDLLQALETLARRNEGPSIVVAALPTSVRLGQLRAACPSYITSYVGTLQPNWFWPAQDGPSLVFRMLARAAVAQDCRAR